MKTSMRLTLLIVVINALSPNAYALDPAGHERILVPIMERFPIPGLAGTMWMTELSVRNESSNPAVIFQYKCEYTCECVTITCRPQEPTPPRTSYIFRPSPDGRNLNNHGVFMYIGRSAASDVALHLRVREVSTDSDSHGTEIPLVRESEMLTRTVHLPGIPVDYGSRHHLRIYAPAKSGDAPEVLVRIRDEATGDTLSQQVVRLALPSEPSFEPPGDPPGIPAFGAIPYLLAAIPASAAPATLIVTLEPLTSGLEYWAFVAITNNETHHVTLVTPQ